MCGIAGLVGPPTPDEELLTRMAQRMKHRGPDSQGTWHDGQAGLAIRRLAIIDLDERSNQPLHLGPWHLVFNGEIYNYRELRRELEDLGHVFETEGDGEVLLHSWAEWEDTALDRVNGMFAFALWHDERRELVCARDPFGEKPLFWANGSAGLAIASEIRALLAVRPDLASPRSEVIAPFLGLGLMPPVDQSFFAGIHQLPAAHLLRFRGGRLDIRRYWRPRRVDVPSDFREAGAALRELLSDSIRLRLRSDVEVGSSLSGGIDSAAIVCLISRIAGEHPRHAFTASFPGFQHDEWAYAEAVASAADIAQHHRVAPTATELLEDLESVVRFQEEPFESVSIYAQWRVMRAARDAGVTVLLDGQGADELFGGYARSNGWALRSQGFPGIVRGLLSGRDRADVVRAVGISLPPKVTTFYWRHLTNVYAADPVRDAAATLAPSRVTGLRGSMADELLRQSFHAVLPALLRYADRDSMAHSREVRLPFLDRRVAEYAFSLPPAFLYRDGATKAVLREAVAGVAPPQVLARRDKVGFEPPQAKWFSEPRFVSLISDVLLDPRARMRGWYATEMIEADAMARRWRDPSGIARALSLELWLQAFQS
jgi:asparagine synthase (glutamine-hydrolysing)